MVKDNSQDNAQDSLWRQVIKSVNPLAPNKRAFYTRLTRGASTSATKQKTAAPLKFPFKSPSKPPLNPSSKPSPKPPAQKPILQKLDPNELRRVAKRNEPLRLRLDLHGQTLAQAKPQLQQFISSAWGAGHKYVLVITGKGVRGQGALRREVPIWLAESDLAALVVGYELARSADGGDGAFYVRLRKFPLNKN